MRARETVKVRSRLGTLRLNRLVLKRTPAVEKAFSLLRELLDFPLQKETVLLRTNTIIIAETLFDDISFILSLIRSLYETLGAILPPKRMESAEPLLGLNMVRFFNYCWSSDQMSFKGEKLTLLVKWFKYHLTLPLSRIFHDSNPSSLLPPAPSKDQFGDPVSSTLRNFLFLITRKKKGIPIAWTLFQGTKRGCGQVP